MDSHYEFYLRYLDGDDDAFVELIREYKDGLILFLDSFVHDSFLAEDLAQETFVSIAIRKPLFVPRAQFKTWLYTIARNLALDCIRKKQKCGNISLETVGAIVDNKLNLEHSYLQYEQRIVVRKALRKLKSDYAQVLFLVYFEGFNNTQVARIMKKSKRQIENLLYQAKKALKNELNKEELFYEKF